jgi:hypothetical protein
MVKQLRLTKERTLLLNRINSLVQSAQILVTLKNENPTEPLKKEELYDILEELKLYESLAIYFSDEVKNDPIFFKDIFDKEIIVKETVKTIEDLITNELIEEAKGAYNIQNLNAPEKAYTHWFNRNLKSISTISKVKTLSFFYALVKKYTNRAISNKQKHFQKLYAIRTDLMKSAKLNDHYKYFFKKDKNNNITNNLIDRIDYAKLKAKIAEVPNGVIFFDFNDDLYEKDLANYKERQENYVYVSSLSYKEKEEIKRNNTSLYQNTPLPNGLTLQQVIDRDINNRIIQLNEEAKTKFLNKFIERAKNPYTTNEKGNVTINFKYYTFKDESQFFSDDYKELIKDKDRLALYEFVLETNKKAKSLGLIHNSTYTFYPAVMSNRKEKLLLGEFGEVFNFTNVMNSLNPDNVTDDLDTKLEVNALTGETSKAIKKLFLNDYTSLNKDGTKNYNNYSFDLLKVYGQFSAYLEDYEAKQHLQEKATFIELIEKNKKNIVVDSKNRAIKRKVGIEEEVIVDETGDNQNLGLLQKFMDFYIYDITGYSNSAAHNKSFKIMNKTYKFNTLRLLSGLMSWRSNTTLALNVGSGFTALGGGFVNLAVEAGKNGLFTRKDVNKSLNLAGKLALKDKEALLSYGLLHNMEVIIDGKDRERIADLSFSKLNALFSTENLYIFLRLPDAATQLTSGLSILNNYAVRDGKLIQITELAKNQLNYDQLLTEYADNKQFSKISELDKQLNTLIEELKEKESILVKNVEYDGKYEEFTQDLQEELRSVIKKANKLIIGNSSRDDVNLAKTTLLGKLLLQFKSWMPQLISQRWGEAEIDNDTKLLNWGKYNTLLDLLRSDMVSMIRGVLGDLNDITYERLQAKYQELLDEHIENGGTEEDFITFSQFRTTYEGNIKSALKEIGIVMAFLTLITAIAMMFMDDDDDASDGIIRYLLRLLNRIQNELSFFFNPRSFTELFSNPIPVISVLNDALNFGSNLTGETWNQAQNLFTDNEEEDLKKYNPTKYGFKLMPITKEVIMWMAMIDEEFRKENNIKIQSE